MSNKKLVLKVFKPEPKDNRNNVIRVSSKSNGYFDSVSNGNRFANQGKRRADD